MTDSRTNAPILVDATLRDGGYANNYGFTCTDVQRIAAGLRDAGISMIEIGHGFGLGADRGFGKMAETDAAYIRCLAGGLDGALFGMFANANIATKSDVVEAARLGLQFLRVGCIGFTEPHPFSVALEFAELAKAKGMWASINLVRTNYLTFRQLEVAARDATRIGADAIYVVDSTGGTFPNQVAEAVRVLRSAGEVPVGFHGHQNFNLAIANSLAAVEAGATYVDGTLGGIGRDSGNAQIDVLAAALEKAGQRTGVDITALGDVARRYVAPLFDHPIGITAENLVLGRYDLLSHGLKIVHDVALRTGVDEQELLNEIGRRKPNFEDDTTISAIADDLRDVGR